jgi:hypothetical protein
MTRAQLGIEVRIGRTINGGENGIYWCFTRDTTIREILKEAYDHIDYKHWLGKFTIALWKDWDNMSSFDYDTYEEIVVYDELGGIENEDLDLTLGELVLKRLSQLKAGIPNSVIREVKPGEY